MIRARFMRRRDAPHEDEPIVLEIQPGELQRVFVAPAWLRDAGVVAWLLVGIVVVLVGLVWLLALTSTIVVPVITATIAASVGAPVVGLLRRHGVPRGAGAAIVLVALMLVGAGVLVVVVGGITDQSSAISDQLQHASDRIASSLEDTGTSHATAQTAQADAHASLQAAGKTLLNGIARGISGLASLAAFAAFTALSLFFLLKDGPVIRSWAERHSGVPRSVAHVISGRTLQALRGYFAGVTAVALFNAVVIGLGALVLGVPRAGTIAVVNFVTAYVPYLGAWSAGAFTVLIALGAKGPETALAMAVITLLANGALQQMIQPIAYGATLDVHPLGILIVTIAGGALFGAIGLILAAPLTSAALRVAEDLAKARARVTEGPDANSTAGYAPPRPRQSVRQAPAGDQG
jgi:putative heme transporter